MITDINFRSRIGPVIQRQNLNDYWSEYFTFQRGTPALHEITERELLRELEEALQLHPPYLDSQQAISRILTKLGSRHNFHRQFTESFPDFHSNQILGMQLYRIVLEHEQYWVYSPIQHAGHVFPHATYFIPEGNPDYDKLCNQ
jgi:hypothetical protein